MQRRVMIAVVYPAAGWPHKDMNTFFINLFGYSLIGISNAAQDHDGMVIDQLNPCFFSETKISIFKYIIGPKKLEIYVGVFNWMSLE